MMMIIVVDPSSYPPVQATMIDWWYNVVKPTFDRPGRSQLRCIFTDTDSFCFAVDYYDADANVYADIANIAETLDLSVYQDCHPVFTQNPERREHLLRLKEKNAGVLGVRDDDDIA